MWANVLATFTAGAAMACPRFRVRWVFALCWFVFVSGIGLFVACRDCEVRFDAVPIFVELTPVDWMVDGDLG
jgi:hypothetical protein